MYAPFLQRSVPLVNPGRPAAPGDAKIESLRWLAPHAILMSMLAVSPGDSPGDAPREEDDVIYMGLTWQRWDGTAAAAPEGVAVSELALAYMGVRWRRRRRQGGRVVCVCVLRGLSKAPQLLLCTAALRRRPCIHRPLAAAHRSTMRSMWAAATAAGPT